MKVNYKDIKNIYDNEISKNVKNKKRLYKFDLKKEEYLFSICKELEDNTYRGGIYNLFLVFKPKVRVIMSQNIYDKIINHYVCRYILEPKLTKYLDLRNSATRTNMGTEYTVNLLLKYINNQKHQGNFYFLKMDISKFFYTIDHEVLKELLKNDLTQDEQLLIFKIIDSTDLKYINHSIEYLSHKHNIILPNYEKGKGLPIGNLTSQFLAIFYLSKLHHYIIHDLHLNKMCIYMDDYLIIHEDKEYLKYCLKQIESKLNTEYKLSLNIKKTYIKSCKEGVLFLGYHFKIKNDKTVITIPSITKTQIRKKIKELNYLKNNKKIPFESIFCSINTIKSQYHHAKTKYIENCLQKYWYH